MTNRAKVIVNIQTQLKYFIRKMTTKTEFLNASINEEVNETQAHILMLLDQADLGKLTNSRLAVLMNVSKPAITKIIKVLEREGYLICRRDENDRRISYPELTAMGRLVAATHVTVHMQSNARLVAVFDKYSEDELVVIQKFIGDMGQLFKDVK
ncbi:MarR family winged helix-turn-helix transcriptional regulator [Periweissella beninensis]|uniref:MarR family winged helix-turn-helix transcriptional regulator n=1 Tax=Periweissella beninensis TaxID=504936 RepID=UPI0021A260EC|nr:MarR family transcriptional regulator [Periweissella beninensis]MCT4396167.1 MarR family transcriptional regulator [Periweissella beninensis]